MGAYIDYFQDWIQEKGQEYENLQDMFRKADEGFRMRFGDDHKNTGNSNAQAESEYFEKNLETIDKEWDTYQEESLKKMAYLTKGNILLRKGQYLGEHFRSPQKCYQQACVVLEQGYAPGESDFLNLMIQLNLGKYFRNMGRHNTRSDYWRALDEFNEVKNKIDKKQEQFSRWETHIWLEAMMNIGRVERYLYHLEKAKKLFLYMISLLLQLLPISISINDVLDEYIREEKDHSENMVKQLNGNKVLYEDYLIQALVQLGIAYQKSQEYKTAQDICVTVLKMDTGNVDAANNLGVCLRKQGIAKSLNERMDEEKPKNPRSKENASDFFDMTYEEIFRMLGDHGNRFAKLQHIKCNMHEEKPNRNNLKKDIEKLLKDNADDQEVLLLYGLFWQKFGNLNRSQQILRKLYKQAPQITKGSIGLKAYYNIANNLLRQNKFHEAKKYYEHILEVLAKENDYNYKIPKKKDKYLSFFPTKDLLAEIDLGWCLMNLGDYEKAEERYKGIWELYQDVPDNIRVIENKMKIKNNLAECMLYLVKGADEIKDMERLNMVRELLESMHKNEPNNAITNRHLGYYHMLMMNRKESDLQQEVKAALEYFKMAETYNMDDVYIHAGWVSAVVPTLLNEKNLAKSVKKELVRSIENKLKYSSGIYSIKACAKLASFIVMQEKECLRRVKKKGMTTREQSKLLTMYRSLSRIRLSKREEGYEMFRRFIENDEFRRLEAAKRGEILVGLFRLYEQIIKIKDICRYVQNTEKKNSDFLIPVHYTKIGTLKKLLKDEKDCPGKLRLWNTVYMNDSFEGESFVNMMKCVEKKRLEKNQIDSSNEIVMKMMKRYFPYLNEESSEDKLLVPLNDNIYVFSFSKAENEIYMWVSYAEDAKGCAITFENDFFDIRKTEDTLTDVSSYSDKDYPLYEIQYMDKNDLTRWVNMKSGGVSNNENIEESKIKIIKILDIMDEMWEILDDLESRMAGKGVLKLNWNGSGDGQKETQMVRNFVAGCLNEVRFLIKGSEYSHEKEVRMLHYSYEPKIDAENFDVPRLYVEVERDIRIKEVKLGSKISDPQINEIVSWLTKTGKVERITKSERHYK